MTDDMTLTFHTAKVVQSSKTRNRPGLNAQPQIPEGLVHLVTSQVLCANKCTLTLLEVLVYK